MRRKINPVLCEKSELLKKLVERLYKPIDVLQQEAFHKIINNHYDLTGQWGFWYRGKGYGANDRKVPIHDSLLDQFEKLYADISNLKSYESKMVEGYLVAVLNISSNPNDYCKVLPDYFHQTIEGSYNLQGYPPSELTDDVIQQFNKRYESITGMIGNRLSQLFISNYCK